MPRDGEEGETEGGKAALMSRKLHVPQTHLGIYCTGSMQGETV